MMEFIIFFAFIAGLIGIVLSDRNATRERDEAADGRDDPDGLYENHREVSD